MHNPQLGAYLQTLVDQKINLFDAVQSQTVIVIRHLLEVEKKKILEQQKLSFTHSSPAADIDAKELTEKVNSLLRDVVNAPGWYGIRLLHKACVRGSYDIIECLLSYGADPNVVNDNGETPLHFAVRKGDLYILELLYHAGASVEAVDKKGRHASHHAASTGNMLVLQWLEQIQLEVIALQERVGEIVISYEPWLELRDEDGRTPLFLACEMGHRDVVKFLLKRQMNKGSILQAVENSTGNTCIHAALLGGHDEVMYLCVTMPSQNMGFRLINTPNNNGETLLQLFYRLRNGGTAPDSYVSPKWLLDFIPRPASDRDSKYRNARITLLCLLLAVVPNSITLRLIFLILTLVSCAPPLILPPFLINLAEGVLWSGEYETWFKHHYLFTSTLIYTAGSAVLLLYVRYQTHRVPYSSRSPNPIWCACFISGIIASTICFFVRLAPVIYHHLLVFQIFVLAVTLALFLLALIRDPGWVTENHPNVMRHDTGEKYGLLEVLRLPQTALSRTTDTSSSSIDKSKWLQLYCAYCERAHNVESIKHCKLCHACVLDFDHHCLYILRCVGHRNMRIFLWFNIFTLLCVFFFLYSAYYLYFPLFCNQHRSNILLFMYCSWKNDRAITTMSIFNALSFVWGISIIYTECQAIAYGGGYYFTRSRPKLSLKVRIVNVLSYLFLGRLYYSTQQPRALHTP